MHLRRRVAPASGLMVLVLVGCTSPPDPGTRSAALAPSAVAGPTRVRLRPTPDLSLSLGAVVVRGAWGTGPGEFGRREEASRPGPMSLTVDDRGHVYVLDAVNRRAQEFDREGIRVRTWPLPTEAVEDLLVTSSTLWVLAYAPGTDPGFTLLRYRAPGEETLRLRLRRSIQLVSGLFASGSAEAPDIWVEQQHELHTLVASRGEAISTEQQRTTALGRLDRRLAAGGEPRRIVGVRVSDHLASIDEILPGRFTSRLLEVETPERLLAVPELLTDETGALYATLLLDQGAEDPTLVSPRKVLLAHRAGSVRQIDLTHENDTDTFRSLALGKGGEVYQLNTEAAGVLVRRFDLGLDAGGGR